MAQNIRILKTYLPILRSQIFLCQWIFAMRNTSDPGHTAPLLARVTITHYNLVRSFMSLMYIYVRIQFCQHIQTEKHFKKIPYILW